MSLLKWYPMFCEPLEASSLPLTHTNDMLAVSEMTTALDVAVNTLGV